jgi:hypothetical protein
MHTLARAGAKTSCASTCSQYLPLIASRDEVMELAAKISQLVHPQSYEISLFNRVKASPITLKAKGLENGAAELKSQTTEILRFIKGPPTLELGTLDYSWVRACMHACVRACVRGAAVEQGQTGQTGGGGVEQQLQHTTGHRRVVVECHL